MACAVFALSFMSCGSQNTKSAGASDGDTTTVDSLDSDSVSVDSIDSLRTVAIDSANSATK